MLSNHLPNKVDFFFHREKYQGLAPPVNRSELDFDAGAKYHVAADVPYIRLHNFFMSFEESFSLNLDGFQTVGILLLTSWNTCSIRRCVWIPSNTTPWIQTCHFSNVISLMEIHLVWLERGLSKIKGFFKKKKILIFISMAKSF